MTLPVDFSWCQNRATHCNSKPRNVFRVVTFFWSPFQQGPGCLFNNNGRKVSSQNALQNFHGLGTAWDIEDLVNVCSEKRIKVSRPNRKRYPGVWCYVMIDIHLLLEILLVPLWEEIIGNVVLASAIRPKIELGVSLHQSNFWLSAFRHGVCL